MPKNGPWTLPSDPARRLPDPPKPTQPEFQVTGEQTPLWRILLNGWMAIAVRFGGVQTLLILVLVYLILIGPVSILQAVGRRDLLDKRALWRRESAWQESESGGNDLERAKLLS
jgi:hypothetical protein